jgi:exonuclease SbcC
MLWAMKFASPWWLLEPVWEHLDAWSDGLTLRLTKSRDAAAMKVTLECNEAEETKRHKRALSDLVGAGKVIEMLLQQAACQHADELPEAENRSERRREVVASLDALKNQLVRMSQKDAAMLRTELSDLDSVAIDLEKQTCMVEIVRLEANETSTIIAEQLSRIALADVDTSDAAAQARDEMEQAIARYRAGVRPWAQLKLAEALLAEALRRYREKAQGPVVELAGEYFRLMTEDRFLRLLVNDDGDVSVLLAQPAQGKTMKIAALSEGTADQLYLALRLAALQAQRKPDRMMPLVLDDVLITSDDERSVNMFRALGKFAAQSQVVVFTHHHHLLDVASNAVGTDGVKIHRLAPQG